LEKAYKNIDFLGSRDARTIRILSEYLEPLSRFARHRVKDTVVFFGSARIVSAQRAGEIVAQANASQDPARIEEAETIARLARYYEDARELARRVTQWSKDLPGRSRRFIVCSGGGPGIMEAANRGASEAAGISLGLGISLPSEPTANPFITRGLVFEFHYFFMRKFWFAYLAKGLVVFPGGFGTLDELFEMLTLVQTRKVGKPIPIVLYGSAYWNDIIRFDALARWGTIAREDCSLFRTADSPEEAFEYLRDELTRHYMGPGIDAEP
jgi:hypothetical protein